MLISAGHYKNPLGAVDVEIHLFITKQLPIYTLFFFQYIKQKSYIIISRYLILKWPPGRNRKPLVNFAAACVLLGTPDEALEAISKYPTLLLSLWT